MTYMIYSRPRRSSRSRVFRVVLPTALVLFFAMSQAKATLLYDASFENVNGATQSFSINTGILANWTALPSANQIEGCLDYKASNTSVCGTVFGGTRTFWVNPGPSPHGGPCVGIDGAAAFSTPLAQTDRFVGAKYVLTRTIHLDARRPGNLGGPLLSPEELETVNGFPAELTL
jgi:hypothetical protein